MNTIEALKEQITKREAEIASLQQAIEILSGSNPPPAIKRPKKIKKRRAAPRVRAADRRAQLEVKVRTLLEDASEPLTVKQIANELGESAALFTITRILNNGPYKRRGTAGRAIKWSVKPNRTARPGKVK